MGLLGMQRFCWIDILFKAVHGLSKVQTYLPVAVGVEGKHSSSQKQAGESGQAYLENAVQ